MRRALALLKRRQNDAARRRDIGGHEKVRRQRLRRIEAIAVEIGHAVFREEVIVDEKMAGEARAGLAKTA